MDDCLEGVDAALDRQHQTAQRLKQKEEEGGSAAAEDVDDTAPVLPSQLGVSLSA